MRPLKFAPPALCIYWGLSGAYAVYIYILHLSHPEATSIQTPPPESGHRPILCFQKSPTETPTTQHKPRGRGAGAQKAEKNQFRRERRGRFEPRGKWGPWGSGDARELGTDAKNTAAGLAYASPETREGPGGRFGPFAQFVIELYRRPWGQQRDDDGRRPPGH